MEAEAIHFIGVGGIGVSAIARSMLLEERIVTGSDTAHSKVTDELRKAGAKIYIGHDAANVPTGCDLVIHSVAVKEDNPELALARSRGIKTLTYPQALGIISKEKFTIAIAGTHGKTTTTAMAAKVCVEADLDPTVVVGSLFKGSDTNFIAGKSQYLIAEADEYRTAFLNLSPTILSIGNIDLDHTDYYRDLDHIKDAFRSLVFQVKEGGVIVANMQDSNVREVLRDCPHTIVDANSYLPSLPDLEVPGNHNRQNASIAYAIGVELGIAEEAIRQSLAAFEGVWRRFEYKGVTARGTLVYDDYAHNPEKVAAAIEGAREAFPVKRIHVVFQPHLYSRTKSFLHKFAHSLSKADHVHLLPIYGAREAHDPTISSEMLEEAMKEAGHQNVATISDAESLIEKLRELGADDFVMTVGAGDGYKIGERLLEK